MKRLIAVTLAVACVGGALTVAQTPTPYKLGTFESQGRTFVGLVLRDAVVVDLAAADKAVATSRQRVAMPSDMKDLITRYDAGLRERLGEIAAAASAAGAGLPAYARQLSGVKTLPPIMYPTTMLNAAVNYREHGAEVVQRDTARGIATAPTTTAPGDALPNTTSAPGIWERAKDDTRWNPYMFLKASSTVVGEGDNILIPPGRTQIDWECELGVVVGRTASRVALSQARSYIFGYTLELDVSDRQGRGDTRHGSDWLIGKSHDTFAPTGPFIVPKEFVRDIQKVGIKFTLNGVVMQDANTSLMIHSVDELVSFGSNILTLRPGDVIATGSPAGVGSARTPPIYLKPGDKTVCTYEGVGTLTKTVAAR